MYKELIKVDNNQENQDENYFSLIEVYPYLHYETTEEDTEKDLSSLFQVSLDNERCVLCIHVRSVNAQKEIASFLIGKGFENVEERKGNVVECVIRKDKEGDDIMNPIQRRYFSTENINYDALIASTSDLTVVVEFESEKLNEFKGVIRSLRQKRMYRNKWITDENNYIIK